MVRVLRSQKLELSSIWWGCADPSRRTWWMFWKTRKSLGVGEKVTRCFSPWNAERGRKASSSGGNRLAAREGPIRRSKSSPFWPLYCISTTSQNVVSCWSSSASFMLIFFWVFYPLDLSLNNNIIMIMMITYPPFPAHLPVAHLQSCTHLLRCSSEAWGECSVLRGHDDHHYIIMITTISYALHLLCPLVPTFISTFKKHMTCEGGFEPHVIMTDNQPLSKVTRRRRVVQVGNNHFVIIVC